MQSIINLGTASLIIAAGMLGGGYFIGANQLRAEEYKRHVTVKGLAEKEVMADVAIWAFTLTGADENLRSLKLALDNDLAVLLQFIQDNGVDENEVSIGFPNIQDTKSMAYNRPTTSLRYLAKMDITIRTEDLSALHFLMEKMPDMISKGIVIQTKNQWQPVQYLYTKLNDIKPEMIEEATKNARQVAVKFAADSGSQVGKIKTARQGVFSISNRDANTGYIKNVRVVTTVVYLLED